MSHEHFSPAMESAVKKIQCLVSEGIEFPDACWKVARKTGFMVDELRKAYDTVEAREHNK